MSDRTDSPPSADSHAIALAAGPYLTTLRVPTELFDMVVGTLRDLVINGLPKTPFHAAVERQSGGRYRVVADGRTYRSDVEGPRIPDCLVRMLLLAELDAHPQRLHLHAAGVSWKDRGVVIAGFSGSGKSTLTTSLLVAGFDYMTDERVAVDADSLDLHGFPKPVSLVAGSFGLFPQLDPERTGIGQAADRVWQVPASTIGTGRQLTQLRADLLVFVSHQAGVAATTSPVHPVTAVGRLLHDSIDIERYGAESLEVCGRLCTSIECVDLVYDRPEDAAPAIRSVLEQHTARPRSIDLEFLAAERAAPTNDASTDGVTNHPKKLPSPEPVDVTVVPLRRHPENATLLIDGRALVHVAASQELVELDEAATAWYMLVDGSTTLDELVADVGAEANLDPGVIYPLALDTLQELYGRRLLASAP